MKHLLSLLKPYRVPAALGGFFKLLEAIFELFLPVLMARIIDIGVKNQDFPYILKTGGWMFLLASCGYGFAIICQYTASKASQGYGTNVRNKLFEHINRFSYEQMDKFGASTLTNRLTNDINQLQTAVAMAIRLVLRAPILCIGGLISAMIINLKLSLVMFVAMLIFGIIMPFIIIRSIRLYGVVQKKLDMLSKTVGENLSGVRVIRSFGKTETEKERFHVVNKEHTDASKTAAILSAISNPMTTFIMNVGVMGILWFGGIQVNTGEMTQGEIIAFTNYMSQILVSLIITVNLVVLFTKAAASAKRVAEVFDTKPTVLESADAVELHQKEATIVFENVSFSYKENAEPVIENISFIAKAGTTTGIIGLTGSGKTTLANLISRFYDPNQGRILYNNVDLKIIKTKSLRKSIGLVPQKTVLFSGTLRDNLTMGSAEITDEQILHALKTAQAYEFVSQLPDGLSTFIERSGQNLSGGQKQRIAIARALAKNPSVLILDDSGSALDYATEARLRSALKNDTKSMTVFIITQRISSVMYADNILILDEGQLIAQGTHETLLNTCAFYRDLYETQIKDKEEA